MLSLRSDVEPVDPRLVPLFISEIDITQYTQVAILTLLVYNTITTLDKEIKYFWNRYVGILGALSTVVSYLLIILEGLGFAWIENLANILLMRVLALYHQDKRLSACLRTLFGLEAAYTLGVLIFSIIHREIVVGELAKGITACGNNGSSLKVWGASSWAAIMVYEIILMVLALHKAAEHWRETAGFSQFTLVKVLIQDQAIYFTMAIFCSVMQILSTELEISGIILSSLLSILGSPSFLCVLGSYMLVNLKETGERGVNGGTSYAMRTMSNIEFS
ncbi:hypothetical protein DFH11DRAFT_1547956 [Phellopilus nigrolimitatus]|nr:hypothetical protein DFH11DRAFT_1547956 [Phellopilus nigrolimitatus]